MIKLNGVEIKLDKYPDGTFLFKDIPPIGGWCRDNIEWFFESMEELTAVEYITRYCWDHRVVPNLYMPYIPDARMDRVKYENELFTLKYFAQTINSLHFGRVEVLDPHSDVSAALFNKVHVESPNRMIEDTVKKIASDNLMMFYPDSGDMVEISVKTIEKLWNTFEGSVNSKGYKVLDPHIGIIYGDGCTLNNVKKVWEELEKKGFAANNIVFGVGAFCFSAVVEPDGRMVVVTRDMFGIAMKATFGEVNGQPIMIYKDPKTDVSHLKKSHKGCCHVYYDENGELRCRDGYDSFVYDGALKTVFKDGEIYHTEIFKEIRDRLNGRNKDE